MLQSPPPPAPRFDKEAWLRAAMDVLAGRGQAKLNVEGIAKKLGVTKGSFYHHFESRQDFVRSLLTYWAKAFTERVTEEIGSLQAPADERLLALMELVQSEGLDRYDTAFRSWAAQDPEVAAIVREVDEVRYRFIRSLFEEMGFAGQDLEDRVHIWLVYHSAQRSVHLPAGDGDLLKTVRRLHAFFTDRDHR